MTAMNTGFDVLRTEIERRLATLEERFLGRAGRSDGLVHALPGQGVPAAVPPKEMRSLQSKLAESEVELHIIKKESEKRQREWAELKDAWEAHFSRLAEENTALRKIREQGDAGQKRLEQENTFIKAELEAAARQLAEARLFREEQGRAAATREAEIGRLFARIRELERENEDLHRQVTGYQMMAATRQQKAHRRPLGRPSLLAKLLRWFERPLIELKA